MKYIYKIITICLLIPMIGNANSFPDKGKHKKTKTFHKQYNVNSDAFLQVRNKYGNVDVVSWNENSIEIDVEITVSGDDEEKVISRLKTIYVDFEGNNSQVIAKTVIEKVSSGWFWSSNNVNYQIDYKIKIPISNSVFLMNDYGSISLDELQGKAKINCDYGKIILGSLHHENNEINMDYTNNSSIEFINGGSIQADYSSLTVDKSKNMTLNADYSNIIFYHVEAFKFNCDYGNLEVKNANIIEGNGDYLTMRFGVIYKKLNINADYGSIRVEDLKDGFESVKIVSDYTGVKIGLDAEASFKFITKIDYGDFNYNGGGNINYQKKTEKSTSKYYEGSVNGDASNAFISFTSDYGSLKLFDN